MKNFFSKTINAVKYISLFFVSITLLLALLSFNIKGDNGTPVYFQKELDTRIGGPFESSGSTSRYALTKSIAEKKSFFFDIDLAKFASPDVVAINDKYTTLFTPGVSFAAVPFYLIGNFFGLPQLFTYLSTTLFAAINIILIYLISRKLLVSRGLSIISGLVFGFATTATSYSNTLTQHHLSVFLILLGILNAAGKRSFINNLTFGLIAGTGILVDIPNAFMMLPIGIFIFFKNFSMDRSGDKYRLKMKLSVIALILGIIPMLGFFGWYNFKTTGSYTKLAQSIGRTDIFATNETKEINKQNQTNSANTKPPILPFETRLQLNGLYILLVSDERGIFYYSPVLIFGILGLIVAVKNKVSENICILIITVASVNLLLYSMFGDPWGGWSYGPRYLIPSMALLSTGIGYILSRTLKNIFIAAIFSLVLIYSVVVSTLGSFTTNLVPPKVEALNLAVTVPYTYLYNIQLSQQQMTGTLLYNTFFKKLISLEAYIYIYSAAILIIIFLLYFSAMIFAFFRSKNSNRRNKELSYSYLKRRIGWS